MQAGAASRLAATVRRGPDRPPWTSPAAEPEGGVPGNHPAGRAAPAGGGIGQMRPPL